VSACGVVAASCGFLLLAGLVAGCEVNSLAVQSPGTPADTTTGPKADLAPGSIQAPVRLRLDSLLEMQVGVRNNGSRSAGPGWFVRVFLSTDPVIDPSDHQIDQFAANRELPPGGQDSYLRHKKLSGIAPGLYYIGSMVDVTHLVPESTETNNAQSAAGTISLVAPSVE
jgi:hypothetical protein